MCESSKQWKDSNLCCMKPPTHHSNMCDSKRTKNIICKWNICSAIHNTIHNKQEKQQQPSEVNICLKTRTLNVYTISCQCETPALYYCELLQSESLLYSSICSIITNVQCLSSHLDSRRRNVFSQNLLFSPRCRLNKNVQSNKIDFPWPQSLQTFIVIISIFMVFPRSLNGKYHRIPLVRCEV